MVEFITVFAIILGGLLLITPVVFLTPIIFTEAHKKVKDKFGSTVADTVFGLVLLISISLVSTVLYMIGGVPQ